MNGIPDIQFSNTTLSEIYPYVKERMDTFYLLKENVRFGILESVRLLSGIVEMYSDYFKEDGIRGTICSWKEEGDRVSIALSRDYGLVKKKEGETTQLEASELARLKSNEALKYFHSVARKSGQLAYKVEHFLKMLELADFENIDDELRFKIHLTNFRVKTKDSPKMMEFPVRELFINMKGEVEYKLVKMSKFPSKKASRAAKLFKPSEPNLFSFSGVISFYNLNDFMAIEPYLPAIEGYYNAFCDKIEKKHAVLREKFDVIHDIVTTVKTMESI